MVPFKVWSDKTSSEWMEDGRSMQTKYLLASMRTPAGRKYQ
jgi:hypothetical protein